MHGCDYNGELVEWCGANLPFLRATVNGLKPPLPYVGGSFDLVYALSVFTHLHEDLQRGWRDELHRVLAPGGLLLVTTHGRSYLPRLSDADRTRFERGEQVVQGAEFLGENLCITYHPEASARALFADCFGVAAFVPEGAQGNPTQDLWLLRKR